MSQINAINAALVAPLLDHVAPQQINDAAHPPMIPHNLAHPQQAQQMGAQQVNAQPLQQLAGQVAPNQEGFFQKVGRWFREGSLDRAGLPPTVNVPLPNGGTVTFRGEELAPMIKSLPRLDRADARINLVAILEQRMAQGHDLLQAVTDGSHTAPPSMQDVSDLMLFISSSAKATGADFSSGAFNVADPQGRLSSYLHSSPEIYQRSSSHMERLQSSIIDGHRNTHRGIDVKQGLGGLPNGHATLLFARIPDPNNGPARLFLKMESCGCRLNTLFKSQRDQNALPDRPVRASDIPEAIGHAFSFLATRGAGGAAGSRKERIPDGVKREFKALLVATQGTPAHQTISQGNPLNNSSGIRTMMGNLRAHADAVRNDPAQYPAFLNQTLALRTELSRLAEVKDLDARIGNEVTRSLDELINIVPQPALTPADKLNVINQHLGI